jgi:hypothetical protein
MSRGDYRHGRSLDQYIIDVKQVLLDLSFLLSINREGDFPSAIKKNTVLMVEMGGLSTTFLIFLFGVIQQDSLVKNVSKTNYRFTSVSCVYFMILKKTLPHIAGGQNMSLEAHLDRYLHAHMGERVQIAHLAKRFQRLPNEIIRKLEVCNWRHCGGGYFIHDSRK